jgi:signal transduction histidine kinase
MEGEREQLLATLAHELRSPLNGIKTWAHVLESHLPEGDATARRALDGILRGVDQQVQLIDDLLARSGR